MGRIAKRNPSGAALGSTRQLLAHLLDEPALLAEVRELPPASLAHLIHAVGLEDAGEIIALATTAQLERIFDDDLWVQDAGAGLDPSFDPERFVVWLEVMLEAGETFVADKLADLSAELVTYAIARHVHVLDLDALAVAMADRETDEDDLADKALESALSEELDEWLLVARVSRGWDALLTAILALDRRHPDVARRVLSRCAAMTHARVEDEGLYEVLDDDASLLEDVASLRDDRLAKEGFVAPSHAASFLALARTTSLDVLAQNRAADPVSRAWLRELDRAPPPSPPEGRLAKLVASHLRAEERRSPVEKKRLAARASSAASSTLRSALASLRDENSPLHATRLEELAFLVNVIVAAHGTKSRRLRPIEAAEIAVAVVDLGASWTDVSLITSDDRLPNVFAIGWHLLVWGTPPPPRTAKASRTDRLVRATLGSSPLLAAIVDAERSRADRADRREETKPLR